MFQDVVAVLAGFLIFGWWLADWIRSPLYMLDGLDTLDMLDWAKLRYSLNPSCTTKVLNLLLQDPDGRLP